MSYFTKFPKTKYDMSGSKEFQIVTNIFFRVGILNSIKNNIFAYIPYKVKDGERMDIIAEKVYNDVNLYWLIPLANDMVDPIHDWPKDNYSFDSYIVSKYGSLTYAKTTQHHYEKIISRKNLSEDIVTLELTEDEYNATPESSFTTYNLDSGGSVITTITRHSITLYDWEVSENDKRRDIKLIRPIYIPQILDEFNKISRQSKGLPEGFRTFR
jgi:hypothetical protein